MSGHHSVLLEGLLSGGKGGSTLRPERGRLPDLHVGSVRLWRPQKRAWVYRIGGGWMLWRLVSQRQLWGPAGERRRKVIRTSVQMLTAVRSQRNRGSG
jgi:hypothetical protein